ncbi:hypothetical protein ABGN05_27160 [Aquibium sp. LZ166]|uniref:Helix-turn-helix domain-containing protein n=1 Tax=Aquibium pacificus TaxID=3153579 RepID=A0ABV3SSB2_9HYPH
MSHMLSNTQIASWLNVSERTVSRMSGDGRLPKPISEQGRQLHLADAILPEILQHPGVMFAGSVTLQTANGPVCFEVIKPCSTFKRFGMTWAVFKCLHGRFHIREWKTAFAELPEYLDHGPIILSCIDEQVDEFPVQEAYPEVFSAPEYFWDYLQEEFKDPRHHLAS